MPNILEQICADKKELIKERKSKLSLTALEEQAKEVSPIRGFANALRTKVGQGGIGLIAELKKASPSKGLIREDFDPASLALAYEEGGATCLSVLTDEKYFQGEDGFLNLARNETDLPVLRKDFMLDPYQIVEARTIGADCVLLIMAVLDAGQAKELEMAAIEFHMDVLLEVHDEGELEQAFELESQLIGVNNRNLKTLEIDLATTELLVPRIPNTHLAICESGIHDNDDIRRMQNVGVQSFLVGEALMAQEDVAAATSKLLGGANSL